MSRRALMIAGPATFDALARVASAAMPRVSSSIIQTRPFGPRARYVPSDRELTPRYIELTTVVPVEASLLYDLWTTPSGARRFFGVDARIEPRLGGLYEIDFEGPDPGVLLGPRGTRVVGIRRDRDVAFEWTVPEFARELNEAPLPTWVEVHLDGASDGTPRTTVRLGHYGFGESDPWPAVYRFFEANWFEVMYRFRGLVDRELARGPGAL